MSLVKAKLANLLLRRRVKSRDLHPNARANLEALEGLDLAAPLSACRFVVLDTETTGMDPETDRVVSVGAVRVVQGRVRLGEAFSELVNPGRDIPAMAVKVHGITPDKIASARHGAEVFEDFLSFLGRDILVAHYAKFDLHFINRVMRGRYGFSLQNLVLDTVLMCQAVVLASDPYGISRHQKACRLEALAQRFGIAAPERHTALGDALITAMVFQRMLARLEAVGGTRLKDLMRVAQLK
ncbi:MAG: 3'-5' exonuclease [Desulfarculaceae bacterium]|nr:3'-5' exonuclease [Desulfarculaceae bacterium]MCF8049391.1 3'-5' exonuclease [Desulfarculaceae bacterium]MCF8064578.1 3'-5' exonuclease [Desulfarculaceae bacterium]MCF8097561.1 3'-5' exonuclease [Desulfarculaceae bacterium]MCF8123365.1 3'-5' exonuclease [Desulfarculaceae bacterium]